ncbi:hypothetical protein LWI29_023369 [Acer saccharum]|uniref:Leucine-rich repeat-containing N-terminal plant-type domain-containing protein n=1 Tax=Acer saccharum TaxID=4024 RepID=A0AA39SFN8_ACESA|nr:hypothetical protein LWI29_023369 [Acer saccharum]
MGVKSSSRACNDWKICAEVFVGIILIWAATNSFAVTNPVDVAAINRLFAALGFPQLPGWVQSGGDPCLEAWQGVQCNASDIITIILNGANLGGELGDSLGDFASITVLKDGNPFNTTALVSPPPSSVMPPPSILVPGAPPPPPSQSQHRPEKQDGPSTCEELTSGRKKFLTTMKGVWISIAGGVLFVILALVVGRAIGPRPGSTNSNLKFMRQVWVRIFKSMVGSGSEINYNVQILLPEPKDGSPDHADHPDHLDHPDHPDHVDHPDPWARLVTRLVSRLIST